MGLHVVTGRCGSGKSAFLRKAAAQCAAQGRKALLLAPDQDTFENERALMELTGRPLMDVQVLGFSRLTERVLKSAGGSFRLFLSPEGRRMALRQAIEERGGELSLYRSVSARSGFAGKMGELISVFKHGGVSPLELQEYAQRTDDPLLRQKLSDIALLYDALSSFMAGRYIDSEDAQELLIERMGRAPFLRQTEVFVDLPHSFLYTRQTYRILSRLMELCPAVTVALRLQNPGDQDALLFSGEARTLALLRDMASELSLPFSRTHLVRPEDSPQIPAIAAVERYLYRRDLPKDLPQEGLTLCPAPGRRAEVSAAMAHLDRLLEQGARPQDIYLVLGDQGAYLPLLRPAFAARGLTLYADERRTLASHPVVELCAASLAACLRSFRAEEVLRVAKTGYSPLSVQSTEALEDYVKRHGIRFSAFTRPFERGAGEEQEERRELFDLAEDARSRLMEPLLALKESLESCRDAKSCCEALYQYLDAIGLQERLSQVCASLRARGRQDGAAENAQVWNALMALLDQIALLMEGPMRPGRFAAVLEEGCAATTVGVIPAGGAQIGVGDVQRASSRSIRHLLMLGCIEGAIPCSVQEDGVMDDGDVSKLDAMGLSLFASSVQRGVHERHIAYACLSRPGQSLFVSWPECDSAGRTLPPSSLAERLCALFPDAVAPPRPTGTAEAGNEAEGFSALLHALRRFSDCGQREEGMEGAYAYYSRHPLYASRLRQAESRLFGERPVEPGDVRPLYGLPGSLSVTRLERFNRCPFQHFIRHGLRPDEFHPYEEGPADEGSFYHEAFRAFCEKVWAEGVPWEELDEKTAQQWLDGILEDMWLSHNGGLLLDGARNRATAERMQRTARRTLSAMIAQIRAGGFRPAFAEAVMGQGGVLPPLQLQLADGRKISLSGVADRVDLWTGESATYVRIVDYKTGDLRLSYAELDAGLQLQLPLYLKAAAQCFGEPAGMFYLHVCDPVEDGSGESPEDGDGVPKEYRLRGLLLGDEAVVRAMDGISTKHSPFVPVQFTASGVSGSALLPPGRMDYLLRRAHEAAQRSAQRIWEGEAAPLPSRIGASTACDYCDYAPICRFEPRRGGVFREIAKMDEAEFFKEET